MISYVDFLEGITAHNLEGFFEGWPNPPSPETHLKILANSDHIVLAVNGDTGKVIGVVTAITDHVLSAHITLLEVLPGFRGRGIAKSLMQRMFEKLANLYGVSVCCDKELQPFYARFGMRPIPSMVRLNYQRQSGR